MQGRIMVVIFGKVMQTEYLIHLYVLCCFLVA